MTQVVRKYNWKNDGTPQGCDSHCIPYPCGICKTDFRSEKEYIKSFRSKKVHNVADECYEFLDTLLKKFQFLHPENPRFDYWDNQDAANVVAFLCEKLKYNEILCDEMSERDFGK